MHAKKLFDNQPDADLSNAKAYVEALIVLQSKALAYYHILVSTEVIWTRQIPTGATDGFYIYINPDFFKEQCANPSQRAFLLAHEVGHIVFKHPSRGKFYRLRGFFSWAGGNEIGFSHKAWNFAGDYVINADLIAHGLEMIDGCLLDERFSRNDMVDNVYRELWDENQAKKQEQEEQAQADMSGEESDDSGDDQSDDQSGGADGDDDESDADFDGQGSDADDDFELEQEQDGPEGSSEAADEDSESGEGTGEGQDDDASDEPVAGSGGDPFDDILEGDSHDDHLEPQYEGSPEEVAEQEKADLDDVERRIDEALDTLDDAEERGERQRGASKGFERNSNRHNGGNATATDWRAELQDRVTRIGANGESSWKKIHRRRFTVLGTLTPSRIGTFDRMVWTVDISGSVDRVALHQATLEAASAIDMLQPVSGCLVLFTNTEVVEVHEVFSGGELLDLEIPMGGGTTMCAAAEYLEENGIEADIHLCFTDGYMDKSDYEACAEAGMVLVLDRLPYSHYQRMIDQCGIDYIIACDDLAA